jgi:hypothetical protein
MGTYKAKLTVPDVFDWPLAVEIDLNGGRIAISSSAGEIGSWDIGEVEVRGRDDGFELRADGDLILLSTSDDGRFAHEVNLQWAPPGLRRLMAAHLAKASSGTDEVPVRIFPATGLRQQLGGFPRPEPIGRGDQGVSPLRIRRGRHQRRGKGRHVRPVGG